MTHRPDAAYRAYVTHTQLCATCRAGTSCPTAARLGREWKRTRSATLGSATPELPPTTGRVEHHSDHDDGSAPCNVDDAAAPRSRGPTGPGSAPSAGRAG